MKKLGFLKRRCDYCQKQPVVELRWTVRISRMGHPQALSCSAAACANHEHSVNFTWHMQHPRPGAQVVRRDAVRESV